jgi:acetyl esterase/lipase
MKRRSGHEVTYLELPGAQHSFDLIRSIRNEQVVRQAADFTDRVRAGRVADGGAKP